MDVQPEKQSIDSLFSRTVFYIDFYQRDYRWNETPVHRLLDDIFYPFSQAYAKHQSVEPSTPDMVARYYPWYYMNTYVTNTVDGKVFVVDGQQRLTTLTLILIKLKHLAKKFELDKSSWLESKIVGYSATGLSFWMNHSRHLETMKGLFETDANLDSVATDTGITAENLVKNYKVISKVLDARLDSKHHVDTFILYFLTRLVIINLSVDQTDVPMVFEVINDRGVKLKPYEIIKGKLLGQIDKVDMETDNFNELWETKGKDNISSGNELYTDKLKSYANTLYWNETLRQDSYKSKLDFRNFIETEKLDFQPFDTFGPNELESRHRLLFGMAKKIWG